MITKFKIYEDYDLNRNGEKIERKYWKVPIDDYLFLRLDKINVSKKEQKSIYDHYLIIKNDGLNVSYIFIQRDLYDETLTSFNPNNEKKIIKDGYIKQPDIELTPEEIEEWKFKKNIKKFNV